MKKLVFLFTASALLAQVATGLIVGTLHDQTGAIVPGATITATEVNTNTKFVTHSDAAGNYFSPPLRVGTYTVTAETPGFRTQSRENIVLQVQDRLRVDFDMQVGEVSERVVVSADAPLIQTETSSLVQGVNSEQVSNLPLNG